MNGETERRGRINRVVGWIYHWLDLYGPADANGRRTPANTKVLSTFALLSIVCAEVWWGYHLSRTDEGAGIGWPYVTLLVLTLAAAMGKDVFKAALKLRWGPGSGNGKEGGEG